MNNPKSTISQQFPIFYDPTGKRWNVSKITFIVLFVILFVLTFYAIVFLYSNYQYAAKGKYFQDKNTHLQDLKTHSRKTFSIINPELVQANNFNALKQNYKTLDNVILDIVREKDGKLFLEIDNLEAVLVYFKTDTKSSISILIRENQLENIDKLKTFLSGEEFKKQAVKYSFNSLYLSLDNGWYLNSVNEINKEYKDIININYIIDSQFDYKSIAKNIRKPTEVILNLNVTKENEITDKNKKVFVQKLKDNLMYLKTAELGSNLMLPSTPYFSTELKTAKPYKNIDFASLEGVLENNAEIITDNLIPKITSDSKQFNIVGNWFYYNFISMLNDEGLQDNNTSLGLQSISEADPDSLAYFKSIKNWDGEKNYRDLLYFFNFRHDVITQGFGLIQTFVQDEFNGKVNLDIKDDRIIKIHIKSQPIQAKIDFSGSLDKTVAITFDDGPSSYLTKEVLKVLEDKGVKATFFVTGTKANKYPETIKQVAKEGHQIENHSYSHTKLADIVDEQIEWEITETNKIIEKLTGRKPRFFRTPYNSFGYVASSIDLTTTKLAQRHGLKLYEVDTDSKDYKYNNVEDQLKNIFPKVGTQILFHDGLDNNESKMPEALGKTIDRLKEQGYKFTTIDGYQNASPKYNMDKSNVFTPVTDVLALVNQNSWFYNFYIWFVFGLLGLSIIRTLILLFSIIFKSKRNSDSFYYDKPVTVIVPCYNEKVGVIGTINSLLNQDYKNTKILVVDDGSTDDSATEIIKHFGLNSRVRLIKKPNGGKSSALNIGIENCDTDVFVSVDADTFLGTDAVRLLVKHFADPKIGGVAGKVEIANDYYSLKDKDKKLNFFKNYNPLVICQILEYLSSQNFDKVGMSNFNSIAVIPGALGAFDRNLVISLGKYQTDTLAEDTNLTLDIIRSGKKVIYEKNAKCYTEAPETLQQFKKQRFRWNFGTLQVLWKNRDMIFRAKFGPIGFFTMPYMILGFFTMIVNPIVIFVTIIMFLEFLFSNNLQINYSTLFESQGDWRFYIIILYAVISVVILLYSILTEKNKHKYSYLLISPIASTLYSYYMGYITFTAFIAMLKGGMNGWGHLNRTGRAQYTPMLNTPMIKEPNILLKN